MSSPSAIRAWQSNSNSEPAAEQVEIGRIQVGRVGVALAGGSPSGPEVGKTVERRR